LPSRGRSKHDSIGHVSWSKALPYLV
jgi:hypothetical protein